MILGLVILGPEKLPGVLRKAGRLYGEFKRVTSDAQSELRQALDQPMREIQTTAKSYQNFFVDAAKEVSKDPITPSPSTSDDPSFVPYEAPPTEVPDLLPPPVPSDTDLGSTTSSARGESEPPDESGSQ